MEAWMAFVSIMAILAIVLVGGGLIAFIAHLIIGAFDKEPRVDVEPAKTEMLDYSEYKQTEEAPKTKTLEEYDFDSINEAKADKEKVMAEDEDLDVFDLAEEENEKVEEVVSTEDAEKETEELDDDDFDVDSILDEISNDIIEEEKEKSNEENAPKMSDELESYSIDDYLNAEEVTEEVTEEVEEATEEVTEPVETAETETDEEDEGEEDSSLEIKPETEEVEEIVEEPVEEVEEVKEDESKKVIEELKAQLADLNRQLEAARSSKTEVVTINMTEEECVARLEMLEERLKSVKKDYKTNMKEYRPLKKVMNDLEKYQTKLRRKDTMVAKKKVALYGVNNYVDIDKEKAEKLANDLELLDGLRLSVSHCEEVINANKDRFPILERTNQILEDQIAHIEADIAQTQATLAKIREENGEGENN